jgi:flagellar basal body-associated protein FliL
MKAKEDLTKIRFAANLTAKKNKEKKVLEGKHRFHFFILVFILILILILILTLVLILVSTMNFIVWISS